MQEPHRKIKKWCIFKYNLEMYGRYSQTLTLQYTRLLGGQMSSGTKQGFFAYLFVLEDVCILDPLVGLSSVIETIVG